MVISYAKHCRSCRSRLQEHNKRRRKRPGVLQACSDTALASKPRRTCRSAAAQQAQVEASGSRSLRLPTPWAAGCFSHLLSGERTGSSSSGVRQLLRLPLQPLCMHTLMSSKLLPKIAIICRQTFTDVAFVQLAAQYTNVCMCVTLRQFGTNCETGQHSDVCLCLYRRC